MTPATLHDHLAVLTLWREARGEDWEGILAVALVLRNRVADKRWAHTPGGVVLQRLHFSCWNDRDPNRLKFPDAGDEQFQMCAAAWALSGGRHSDITYGANHYHANTVSPKWADTRKLTAIIGNHHFYKL